MSSQKHPSALTDYSARTWVDDEFATAAKFNAEFGSSGSTGVQTKIADLNDAIQDVNSCHSATSAPTNVQGQLFYNSGTNQLLLDPDAAGADQSIPRVLTVDITPVGATNAVGTLISYTVPADTLKTNGQMLRITAWGTMTTATTAAVIQFRTAAAAMGSFTLPTLADAWSVSVLYVRTGSATEDVIMECHAADVAGWAGASAATAGHAEVEFALASNAVSGTIAIDLRVSTITTASAIVQEGLIVELLG
mgnify:CR=1 FL=1